MKNLIPLALICLTLFSCRQENDENATPEALLEKEISTQLAGLGSSSEYKRKKDIVERLFEEACEKDDLLDDLNEAIQDAQEFNEEDRNNFYLYKRNNADFWNTSQRYAQSLMDSTARERMSATLSELEKRYNASIESHEKLSEEVDLLKYRLEDVHKLVQLTAVLPLIDNYQRNELPPVENMKAIVKHYQKLIKAAEQYSGEK